MGGLQSSTGMPNTNNNRQHSELIEVTPSSTLTINASPYIIVEVYRFDANKVKTGSVLSPGSTEATLTVGDSTKYIRYSIKLSDNSAMNYLFINKNDISINKN